MDGRKTLHYVHFFPTTYDYNMGKGKVHPCTGTEALYRPYGP